MTDSVYDRSVVGSVEVQLLDPTTGRPLKTWTFEERPQITIGRLSDQDVAITDPYVSRTHASLLFQDGTWRLISLGRNGVLIDNRNINEIVLEQEATFRLGPEGPTLRFLATAAPASECAQTFSFDTPPVMVFRLDDQKLRNEVEEIAEGDYFNSLKERAKSLRRSKGSE